MLRTDAKNNVFVTIGDDGYLKPKVYYADRSEIYEIKDNDTLKLKVVDKKTGKTFSKTASKSKPDLIQITKADLQTMGLGKFEYEMKLTIGNTGELFTIITTHDFKDKPHFYICENMA